MPITARFSQVSKEVPTGPGIYEIRTASGTPLKVGIAVNLKRRLLQHGASRQSCLRLKPGGSWTKPEDVISKSSILAKHLYFDSTLTFEYELTTEAGRRRFLEEKCLITFEVTNTREVAREIEKVREQQSSFRYCNKVETR